MCAAVYAHPLAELAITVLTVEEQLSGWYNELHRAKSAPALAAVYQSVAEMVQFFAEMPILSFTEPAIYRYEGLKRLKIKIKKTDLRIAAIALEHNAVVVTRNLRDFTRIPGLQTEDWSK